MLTAVLLIGGGAVAVADPDSSGSSAAHGKGGDNAAGQHGKGGDNAAGQHGKDNNASSGKGKGGNQASGRPSTRAQSPKEAAGGTDSNADTLGSGLVPAVSSAVAATAVVAPAPAPTMVAVAPDAVTAAAPVPEVVAPVPEVVAPAAEVVAPAAEVVAPVPEVVAPAAEVVAPVPEVVAPVPEVVAPAAEVVAPVADLLATESEFFALVQHLLGSVVGAVVPLTQLQSELASFLFDSTGVEPVTNASGYPDGAALSAAVHAWVASEVPLLRAFASFPGVSVAGIAPLSAPLAWIAPAVFCATTQPCGASSLPGLAVQWVLRSAPCEPSPPGLLSRLDAVAAPGGAGLMILNVAGVLPISLAVLAALALPGAGGLTILTAAGVRIGYRQAKAGFVVQTGDIARFARPGAGPVGVVRSGSVVVLPVARPRAVSAGYSFEKAAA